MSIIQPIFKKMPFAAQNFAITLVNSNLYRIRQGGKYSYYRKYYSKWNKASKTELEAEQLSRLILFISYARENSLWYKSIIEPNHIVTDIESIAYLPFLEKKDIISNFEVIKTINEGDGVVNQTSGTTGAAMKTVMTKNDMQERWAIVDNYKAQFGYEFGKRTAWFSGKNLISNEDIKKGNCSHYDFINKIRFYSTFHINEENFDIYWESLNSFKPEFLVGFPSSIYQICEIADKKNLRMDHNVEAFFSTSETLLPHQREIISKVCGCKVANHYSASEGAPIITECTYGRLHMHTLTGVFEVVDKEMNPSNEGELVVTSFTSSGTPLIRYRVGDSLKLASSNQICECGSSFPLVEHIDGRSNDCVYSPQTGRINLVNIGNSAKGINGIVCFQIVQNNESKIEVRIVTTDIYSEAAEKKFIQALRERVGNIMQIELSYVDHIPRTNGGKFRIVKNSLDMSNL